MFDLNHVETSVKAAHVTYLVGECLNSIFKVYCCFLLHPFQSLKKHSHAGRLTSVRR
jgi:hypothetical protein